MKPSSSPKRIKKQHRFVIDSLQIQWAPTDTLKRKNDDSTLQSTFKSVK